MCIDDSLALRFLVIFTVVGMTLCDVRHIGRLVHASLRMARDSGAIRVPPQWPVESNHRLMYYLFELMREWGITIYGIRPVQEDAFGGFEFRGFGDNR